jgi:hypothetical protein
MKIAPKGQKDQTLLLLKKIAPPIYLRTRASKDF